MSVKLGLLPGSKIINYVVCKRGVEVEILKGPGVVVSGPDSGFVKMLAMKYYMESFVLSRTILFLFSQR